MVNQNTSTCAQKVHIFVNLEYCNTSTPRLLEVNQPCIHISIELADLGIPASIY